MKKFLQEFKDFINQGNVVDMAVGVVIGGAFGKIVTSLVSDIIMPAISMITGRMSIADLSVTMPAQVEGAEPIVIAYGAFIQAIIDFLIIAFCIFLIIKLIAKLRAKKEAEPAAPPAPTQEELLLTEIRDILARKKDAAE